MRRLTALLTVLLALAASPLRAQEPAAAEDSFSLTESVAQWSDTVQEVLLSALSLTGVKYKYGGKSPDTGFDCSGFVRYVFQQAANVTLPHGARAISQLGRTIPVEQLQPGDLVFFNTSGKPHSHMGIYAGEGRFIHAPSTRGKYVRTDALDSGWFAARISGLRTLRRDV